VRRETQFYEGNLMERDNLEDLGREGEDNVATDIEEIRCDGFG
jgi:hypothetical protein